MRKQILQRHDSDSLGTAFRAYLADLYREGRQWRFHPSHTAALKAWQVETRARLLDLLGCAATWSDPPRNLRREPIEETRTYRRERLLYETLLGVTVPACLLIPQPHSDPQPAILCPPGHGGGVRQLLDDKDGSYKGYPISLVTEGFICLVPEHLGFGERADAAQDSGHNYYDRALRLLGKSGLGVMLHDLRCALDVLMMLPEVDTERIGCWGLSLGGELTLLLSGVDTRVRAAAISGFVSSYESSFLSTPHCGCGYAPGLAHYLEHADLAALIAPRPLWIEIGDADHNFPYAATESTVEELSIIYALAGAIDHLNYHLFPGGHEVSGQPCVDWFERTL